MEVVVPFKIANACTRLFAPPVVGITGRCGAGIGCFPSSIIEIIDVGIEIWSEGRSCIERIYKLLCDRIFRFPARSVKRTFRPRKKKRRIDGRYGIGVCIYPYKSLIASSENENDEANKKQFIYSFYHIVRI